MIDTAIEVCRERKWGPKGQFCLGPTEVGKCFLEEMTVDLSLEI